jgi:hypothetical protein
LLPRLEGSLRRVVTTRGEVALSAFILDENPYRAYLDACAEVDEFRREHQESCGERSRS